MKLRYRLLLVRHGQAHSNQRGAFLGRQDDPLTEIGRQQVLSLRQRIAEEKPVAIWTSPLKRASDTAQLLGQTLGLEPQVQQDLMEQDYGAWDGLTFAEVARDFPEDFRAWRTGGINLGPSGGENLAQVSARVLNCHRQLDERAGDGETYIWVGHAAAFATLLCGLLGTPLCNQWPYMLKAGSLSEVQFLDFGPRLMRLSWD